MSSLTESAKALLIDIHAALADAPLITARLGDPIRAYDDVPENPIYPYLTYGSVRSEDRSSDGAGVRTSHQISLHVWSRYSGRAETLDLLGRIQSALETTLPHAVIPLYADVFEAGQGGRATPQTRHGLLRLSIITET